MVHLQKFWDFPVLFSHRDEKLTLGKDHAMKGDVKLSMKAFMMYSDPVECLMNFFEGRIME